MSESTRELIARYAKQPSTYVPVVAIIGYVTHENVPPEIQSAVTLVFAGVAAILIGFINERAGPNPNNAPLPPCGTAPVVTPASDQVTAVVVPVPAESAQVMEAKKP